MEKLGADIAKIAVMPRCPEDVLTLLTATVTARRQLTCPVVTMAMAGTGLISRVWGKSLAPVLLLVWQDRHPLPDRSMPES